MYLPEPQENINLLIQDVQREDAQGIMLLDSSWSSKLVECTLSYARENFNLKIEMSELCEEFIVIVSNLIMYIHYETMNYKSCNN